MEANTVLQDKKVVKGEKLSKTFARFIDQKYLQMMVIPGVIWMIIFCYIPMYGIVIAFKDYNIAKSITSAPWVGFDHFTEFFQDDAFLMVLKNTIGISMLKLLIGFPLPIIFALLLNELRGNYFKRFVQTVSYLPHFLSWVVLGGLLMTWLSDSGMLTLMMVKVGLIKEPITFLAEPKYFWGIVISSDIWKELGWSSIIYLAAIAGVDPELYEAATIDGAGRFQKMWLITLPCIKGAIAVLFILAVSSLLNSNFDQILVLRNPLNYDASSVVDIYVYKTGIELAKFSYSTAVGLLKSVIALTLLAGANSFTKKMTGQSLY